MRDLVQPHISKQDGIMSEMQVSMEMIYNDSI